ncbi:MAG TPA: serine hydrolase [Jatrophihabitans sp.]|nr:serine hydrolase [Jatrophihabitans sp.]
MIRRPFPRTAGGLAALAALLVWLPAGPAVAAPGSPAPSATPRPTGVPAAPRPTSTAASPDAPDPHPPAGGLAPDGTVPGGSRLAGRGMVLPAGAPALPRQLTAQAWVLVDLDTGDILAARDPHGRYQPASILKLLTAITVLPHLPGGRVVTVSPQAAHAEGSAVGLLAGARYTVDQLFQALMLVSGNDAAAALAEANGGLATTVAQMNAEAAALGAYDTYVQTPSGLDGWQQLTSAYDMALVLRQAVRQQRLLGYDRLPSASYPPRSSRYGKVGPYGFANQSEDFLTTVPGALLAKTGYTDAAQHTYLAAARRGGRTLGLVFLRNSRAPLDQYQQAGELLGWGFRLPRSVPAVGRLAGPIAAPAPRPQSSLGTALAMGTDFRPAGTPGGRTILIPVTAAAAGAIWLGFVALGGRRRLLRRGSPRR